MGASVRGIALPPEAKQDHFNLVALEELILHTNCDLRSQSSLVDAVGDFESNR